MLTVVKDRFVVVRAFAVVNRLALFVSCCFHPQNQCSSRVAAGELLRLEYLLLVALEAAALFLEKVSHCCLVELGLLGAFLFALDGICWKVAF